MSSILSEIVNILTGGITGVATGVGQGVTSLVQNIFITGEGTQASPYALSVFGGIVVVFALSSLVVSPFFLRWRRERMLLIRPITSTTNNTRTTRPMIITRIIPNIVFKPPNNRMHIKISNDY